MTLRQLADLLRGSRGLRHKLDLQGVREAVGVSGPATVRVGDDCAAIPNGNGFNLLAIEGLLEDFVAAEPWFAGYCGVMVNVSDVYAMGGRPVAVVDAVWQRPECGRSIWEGLRAASEIYGVPIVGGHTNRRAGSERLAVAILGRANRLLTSFDARPDDVLLLAVDLRGGYREPFWHFDASTGGDPARLRADLELLPQLAEEGLCAAAKDVSMGGVVGTLLMLLECSGVGAALDVGAVPRPAGTPLEKWLLTFPSYGFLLAVPPRSAAAVLARFAGRGIACGAIGRCDDSRVLTLCDGGDRLPFWDLRSEPVIGFAPTIAPED
jgi:AIR synthase-related protein